MKKRVVLALCIVVGLGLSIGCQAPQAPAGLSDADRAAIRQSGENYAKSVNAQDSKGAAALYADDAIVLVPNHAAVEGRAAIQAWMETPPPVSNFQMQSLETEGQGDLAYDRGTYSVTMTPAGAGPIEDHGKYLTIFRKQADGSWKVVRDIWNSDLPVPAPEKPTAPAKKKR
jgi:uncharacterized protein (TIGR02246 family)